MSLVGFITQRWFEIMIVLISMAVSSGVTLLVARVYHRKALRGADRASGAVGQQTLRGDMLVLKTSLDNPQNAQERFAIAQEELAKARNELANAEDSVAERIATEVVRMCLIRKLKVAQELPEYQRPSPLYAKLKEETERELESLIRPI